MRVLVPLADGVEELEAVTILDVLRRGGIEAVGAALGKSLQVHGSRGVTLLADAVWDELDPEAFDALALPGGGQATEALAADGRVTGAVRDRDLRRAHRAGRGRGAGGAPRHLLSLVRAATRRGV